jgi:hypothetical protein
MIRAVPLVLLIFSLCGCSSGSGGGGFSLDDYPAAVNATPHTFSGKKPAGHAVRVDSVEKVAADDEKTWQAAVDLSEGANALLFESMDPDGNVDETETVNITLDSVAPTVVSRVPAPDTNGVSLNIVVSVTFSEPVDCATVTAAAFAIQGVTASIDCSDDDPTVTLTPSADLAQTTEYTVTLYSDVADPAGNNLAQDVVWRFTTGTGIDDTPPDPPTADNPAPTSPTFNSTMPVGGWKEPNASVEYRWEVGGSEKQGWTEIAGKTPANSWNHTFDLDLGLNAISLRSVDPSNNISTTTTDFSVQRDENPNQVNPPTVDPVASPTTVHVQVLTGGKDPNTGIRINGNRVVPVNSSNRWDALVQLSPGVNNFALVAEDNSSNQSDPPVDVTIAYSVPPEVNTSGQLKIELEVQSCWKHVGDEFRVGSRERTIIDAYDVQVWIEGPLTVVDDQGNSDPTDDEWEACVFNTGNHQRKYTRYVKTIMRHVYQGCLDQNPPNQCYGYWWEPNYWAPNWFAALVEFGHWNTSATPSGQRIPPGVDRRDDQGNSWWYTGSGPCPPVHFRNPNNNCQPRMTQPPPIDGITQATVAPRHDGFNPPHPATRGTGAGSEVGEWTDRRSYTWNLRDTNNDPVRAGAYLVSINVIPDRALPANIHWPDFKASDYETCWDNPAHDTRGMHRAEGVIVIDNQTAQTVYWDEKGAAETVDACASPNPNIWCDGHIDFSITQNYNNAYATPSAPCSLLGQPVEYLKTPSGWSGPVKVQYCPTGACS